LSASKSVDVRSVLTPTEVDILKMIARGLSVKEIAQERVSSIHTIVTHKKNIFRKIDVHNTYEATHYALRTGLIVLVYYI
jgi:DNA-binding NarL/FixJ family response regulator